MMTDIELETSQLLFSIEKEIVLMELREMMDKLKRVEDELRQSQVVIDIDAFRPCEGVVEPPKKKMRF